MYKIETYLHTSEVSGLLSPIPIQTSEDFIPLMKTRKANIIKG